MHLDSLSEPVHPKKDTKLITPPNVIMKIAA